MSGFDQPPAAPGEGQAASSGGGAPPVPPPLFPTEPTGPIAPPEATQAGADAPQPPQKAKGRGKLAAILAGVGAVIGVLVVKFVLPLLVVNVAADFLGGAFGGPYMQLPGDVRSGYENRIKAALGNSFLKQSESAQTAQLLQLIEAGMSRLDDGVIDTNFRLTAKALGAVDEVSCAGVARAIFVGTAPPTEAATKLVETLTVAEINQWFEIRISAIEAEVRGSPAQLIVTDAEVDPLYDQLFKTMTQTDLNTVVSLAGGEAVEDPALCSAVRGLYNAVLGMSPGDALLFARYDISP